MENTKSRGVSSPDPYWNHAFILHSFWYTKFSADLHHLQATRPANILWPFLMMISQPENLFSLMMIFLKSGTNLQRHQIKLHLYRAKVQEIRIIRYNQEKNLLSLRSNVINIKVNTYFSYMLVISIGVYKGQGIWKLSSKYWLNNKTLHWYNFHLIS